MVYNVKTLEELKKDYSVFQRKYSLPLFEEMNIEFGIEDLTEKETDFLLREVRKIIMGKMAFFSKFIEVILNPSEGGSLFIFSMIKSLKQEDRKVLSELYEQISKIHLESIKRDIVYLEKGEAEFIEKAFFFWKDSKIILMDIMDKIEENIDKKSGKNDKSYFR
jgi:hypothetical protein